MTSEQQLLNILSRFTAGFIGSSEALDGLRALRVDLGTSVVADALLLVKVKADCRGMSHLQTPIIPLICSCCDGDTIGRQWWNRGHGFGVCPKCADWISKHRPFGHDPMTAEEMHLDYGVKGIHYGVEEAHTQPSTQAGQAAQRGD